MLCLHFKASVLSGLSLFIFSNLDHILYIARRNKRESEPKIIKMHFILPVRSGWSRDVQWSAVPHYSLSLATAEHLKHLLITLCHQTICPSIAINWLRSSAFEELKTDASGKSCHSFQWNSIRPQAKFVWQNSKKLSIKLCSHLSGCAKALLRWSLSGFKWNWRRILFISADCSFIHWSWLFS